MSSDLPHAEISTMKSRLQDRAARRMNRFIDVYNGGVRIFGSNCTIAIDFEKKDHGTVEVSIYSLNGLACSWLVKLGQWQPGTCSLAISHIQVMAALCGAWAIVSTSKEKNALLKS